MKSKSILVVDDEIGMCRMLNEALSGEGYRVEVFHQSGLALKRAQEYSFDLIISDIRMPKMSGMELLKAVRENGGDVPVILMTAFGSVESAVDAMKMGAVDYITKPFKTDEIKMAVKKILEKAQLIQENKDLRAALSERYSFKNIVGKSPSMQKIFELMQRIKDLPSTVLITGESGTGKELIARALHFNSIRKEKPFVAIDCSALPKNLLEPELFGYEQGVLAGTVSARPGLLEAANGGTVFLDEIGDMDIDLQAKLLRFLQEGEVRRVGGTDVVKLDVRVIAATHEDLASEIKNNLFRQDLYYRLAVVPIHVPPLRERKDDIPLLVDFILKTLSKKLGKSLVHCDVQAVDFLNGQHWPGNIRELQNALEYAASLSLSPILKREHFLPSHHQKDNEHIDLERLSFREAKQTVLESFEKSFLENILKRSNGNISQAARLADRKSVV